MYAIFVFRMTSLASSKDLSLVVRNTVFGVSDDQGQITLQDIIAPGRNLDRSNTLHLSLLPARIKKIQSKMKALECSQHYTLIFQTLKGK